MVPCGWTQWECLPPWSGRMVEAYINTTVYATLLRLSACSEEHQIKKKKVLHMILYAYAVLQRSLAQDKASSLCHVLVVYSFEKLLCESNLQLFLWRVKPFLLLQPFQRRLHYLNLFKGSGGA